MLINNYKNIKKRFSLVLILILVLESFSYAKKLEDDFAHEVEAPIAESKNNISEGTIVSIDPYHEYNPLNPVPAGVNKEEYDSVDNFNIDLTTLNTRIKYFSPTYTNLKASAESSLWMSYYARGGSNDLVDNADTFVKDYYDLAQDYKDARRDYIYKRNNLNKKDPNYDDDYLALTVLIDTYGAMYDGAMFGYSVGISTIGSVRSAVGMKRALSSIGSVDTITDISKARDLITKQLTTAILSYLQLKNYVDILEKQTKLYKDKYELYKKNMSLGLATALEVKESLDTYEKQKATLKSTKTTMNNVKEQIAINLGYNLSDIDKLNFIEPEVDLKYIDNINIEKDRERAYNSNSSYNAISLSDKDMKLPGSTGEELMNKRKQYVSQKVITSLDDLYANLKAKLLSYQGSYTLVEICNINNGANKRKFENNLVSELEYNGLELQNLANNLQVKVAKYNLINATNDYYYGTMGQINIS